MSYPFPYTKRQKIKNMNNPYASSSRNGKIARLPHTVRDQLNRRLQNSDQAKTLLPWLNNLPEVKTLLAAEFNSRPVNKQNLSDWKKGGFRDWLILQQALEFVHNLESDQAPGSQTPAVNFTDKLARWLALQYAAATRSFVAENPKNQWSHLREFCSDICRLRRGDLYSQLLQVKRDWLALEEKNATYLQDQKFTEWARECGLLKQPEGSRGVSNEVMDEFEEKLGLKEADPQKPRMPISPEAEAEFQTALNNL
jgi:hypothetical protein